MKSLFRIWPLRSAAWALCTLLAFSACNEDKTEDAGNKPLGGKTPEVVSYTPEYTEAGLEVDAMIMGRNFGTDKSKVKVTLDDIDLAVKEVGNSVIKFTIPSTLDVGEYPLSVEIGYTDTEGNAKTVSHRFEVDFEVRGNKPEITGYQPAAGIYPGGEVTVEGQYFGSDRSLVTVKLGETPLDIASVAPGAIVFTVPEDTPIGTYALAVTVKYGVGGGQSTTKTFEGFQVLAKEYVATSSVLAGVRGQQGIPGDTPAKFVAPNSLAYDPVNKLLYVGETWGGIRTVTDKGVMDSYLDVANPFVDDQRRTCAVAISGNALVYVDALAGARETNFLWTAVRNSGGTFDAATGHGAWDNDYTDVAINPVDGYIVVGRYLWENPAMESKLTLFDNMGENPVAVEIPRLWAHNRAHIVFSPDGKWLYIARGSDNRLGGGGSEQPHGYIARYAYDPATHTFTSQPGDTASEDVVAGSVKTNEVGFADGAKGTSRVYNPCQMCFDSKGETLYFVDRYNHALRKVTDLQGQCLTATVAGTGTQGATDVTAVPVADLKNVQFDNPVGLAMADDNTWFVAEDGGKVVRRIEIKLKQ